jgi:deazaflavin-dependent oxidoreductase (nitroreductase family)
MSIVETSEPQPDVPRPGADLAILPDDGWIYGRNLDLEKLDLSGDTESLALDLGGEMKSVVVVTIRGAKTLQPQRIPLMRVEQNGCYALVASKGGSTKAPAWYYNLRANPYVQLQDLTTVGDFVARELVGEERAVWWDRAVQVFQPFVGYAEKAGRLIPVFVLEPGKQLTHG